MGQYFAKDWNGETFVIFGPAHLVFIATFVLINLSFIWLRKSDNQKLKDWVRYSLVIMLIISEASWHIWNIAIGEWTIQTHLPLHLCAVLVWTSVFMLLTKNYKIFEFAYFLGIAGAVQALLTPETGIYGLPHFRVVQTLTAHGFIVTSAIFMTIVEGYRPYWSSFKRVFIYTNIYMIIVTGINFLIKSNYMFTRHKPINPSLIDFLGPWPWYLLSLEFVALALCFLMYLPWIIKDRKSNRSHAVVSA